MISRCLTPCASAAAPDYTTILIDAAAGGASRLRQTRLLGTFA